MLSAPPGGTSQTWCGWRHWTDASTAQYSTTQHNTAQHHTTQHSMAPHTHMCVCACVRACMSASVHITAPPNSTDYVTTTNCKTLHFIASQHTYHLWLWLTHSPQPQSITQSFLTNILFLHTHPSFSCTNHLSTLSSSHSYSALHSHHHPSLTPPTHSYHHYSHLLLTTLPITPHTRLAAH